MTATKPELGDTDLGADFIHARCGTRYPPGVRDSVTWVEMICGALVLASQIPVGEDPADPPPNACPKCMEAIAANPPCPTCGKEC